MAHDEANRQAEKKIEKAFHDHDISLNLSGMGLAELPKSLKQLTELLELNLSFNRIFDLPDWINQLPQLRSLIMSHTELTTLPRSICQLSQLQTLNLSDNKFASSLDYIGQLANLDTLVLSNTQQLVMPEWISKLTNLHSLYLTENELTKLPHWIDQLTQLLLLNLANNQLKELPESLGHLKELETLDLSNNQLKQLPESLGQLQELQMLNLSQNHLIVLPESLSQLRKLHSLDTSHNDLITFPDLFGDLKQLKSLNLSNNQLIDLPLSLGTVEIDFNLDNNPLASELAQAYKEGHAAIKRYLCAGPRIPLNEGKLILVGEGEVGKTCLMDALLDNPWHEHDTTHGIEIRQINVTNPESKREIALNGWDFGGQPVYRPTHQLFFSAPAVYLVVWKPREGPQQGFVKEWIKLVKHREPDAKILVVATHGGPQQRQPDIDRQELWDLFGKDTVLDFFFVESKPDENGKRRGIKELKQAISRVADSLPEMGRSVPKRWQDARDTLAQTKAAYLPLEHVLEICRLHQMDHEEAHLFITIEHRLGHLIHYEHDPALQDIVVLKPNWLATAISFVLDDEATRHAHGLVRFSRLSQLWDDPTRTIDSRYPIALHEIFLRLMERFDLSYRVADPFSKGASDPQSLIAQLVPDNRPDPIPGWLDHEASGDIQQQQICRIVDAHNGQSAPAEGLFYQLIVRLQKYSLGRVNYNDSVHWQRGLVLDDDYNGRALLEHMGNDVRITVRATYPERFLAMLTSEVKYLVESFWEGLRCNVMVPCINPCGKHAPGTGLFEVEKLIESKQRKRPEFPCPVCNNWQNIDFLLRNAPAAQPDSTAALFKKFTEVKRELLKVRQQLTYQSEKTMGRFDHLDDRTRRILSRVDNAYTDLIQALTDEAKEGPRLFSFVPVDRSKFNPREWVRAKFRLTLWCEHSRLPLPALNGENSKEGVYELELTRKWFKKAAPFLKFITSTLSLVLPVASSGIKMALDDTTYKAIEEQLDFGKTIIEASLDASEKASSSLGGTDSTALEHGKAVRAQGATLRELHALLKAKDPGFGGLVRVMNKRQEFLWVHPQFEKEY